MRAEDQSIDNCRDLGLDSARNQRQDAAATTDIDTPTLISPMILAGRLWELAAVVVGTAVLMRDVV